MIIEAKSKFVVLTAEDGMIVNYPLSKANGIAVGLIYFKSKVSGDILTKKLYLGCNDTADNYEEISEVEAYAESNTVQEEKENGVQ